MPAPLLLIDNYDSFVFNLARYLEELGAEPVVVRNDALSVTDIRQLAPSGIVISPGPCTPAQAGVSEDVIRELSRSIPTLGVCLGHQAIATALGGRVLRDAVPVHGRTSLIEHSGDGLFADCPQPLRVTRYHSLIVDESSLPASLKVTARLSDGIVMALAHREWPLWGVQFHPEAVLTSHGHQMLANFLRLAGLEAVVPAQRTDPPPEAAGNEEDFYARAIDTHTAPPANSRGYVPAPSQKARQERGANKTPESLRGESHADYP